MKKVTTFMIMIFATACLLTGCGNFDASGYIKACLDANTHGEFAAYAEITQSEEADIEKQFTDLMEQEISFLDSYNATEEQKDQYRELFTNIYKNFKYEVGEAVANDDDTYTVPVTTYKLTVFGNILADSETYITDYVKEQTEAGADITEDDLYPVIIDYMYSYLSDNYQKLEYAEAVTVDVTVAPTDSSKKVYSLDTAELQSLLESMIDTENAQ